MDVRLRQRPDSQTVGMTRLDKEWAIGEIDAFLYATDQIVPDMSGSGITLLRNGPAVVGD
jgi:hypothetical protein